MQSLLCSSTELGRCLCSRGCPMSWNTSRLQGPAGTPLRGRALGHAPGHHPLLETWFWGWQPPLPPADPGHPLPWEGIADVCLGVRLSRAFWGLCLWGLPPPLLLPPSFSLLPCCCPQQTPSLACPHVVPRPRWRQPLLPLPQRGQADLPAPPALGGTELTESTEDLGDFWPLSIRLVRCACC